MPRRRFGAEKIPTLLRQMFGALRNPSKSIALMLKPGCE